MKKKNLIKIMSIVTAAVLALSLTACGKTNTDAADQSTGAVTETASVTDTAETTVKEEITSTNDSEHAIEVSGETAEYANIKVTKT